MPNQNGKLNVQRGMGNIGSAQPLRVAPANNPSMQTARTASPQPTAGARLQRGVGVSGSKLQGTAIEGRSLTGPRPVTTSLPPTGPSNMMKTLPNLPMQEKKRLPLQ